jgi:ubiquinone/menaquinone biosynthesis C-methylase UbiE/uncharacterized protein YbaR (Trm112 family)
MNINEEILNGDEIINTIEFNRTKIYEKLSYIVQPDNYNSEVPWLIQCQISATNGKHYSSNIAQLQQIPTFELPIKPSKGLMLDIGCGWGRWLSAGYDKGFIPIGIDIRLEFCKTSLETLKLQNKNGYAIVADLECLPFKDNVFDFIWSFSVIQHTHFYRLNSCLKNINRLLNVNGFTKLEFPNRKGIHYRFLKFKNFDMQNDDINSWDVRYYSIKEYKKIINAFLSNFSYENHSFLGIGILKEDLKYLNGKKYLLTLLSLFLSKITNFFPVLTKISDSIYITANKKSISGENISDSISISEFLKKHSENPSNNLNLISLLRCPITKSNLELHENKFLINSFKSWKYPIIDGIPILIKSEAIAI